MGGNFFICPLCGSDDYIINTAQLLEDPISKLVVHRNIVRKCTSCDLILYKHSARGWEGGLFDEVTGILQYYMTSKEVTDGIKDHEKIKQHLPNAPFSVISRKIQQERNKNKMIALPAENIPFSKPKEDIYYIKSSLKGVEVLS